MSIKLNNKMRRLNKALDIILIFYIMFIIIYPLSSVDAAITSPSVTSNNASGVEETNATMQGTLTDDGNMSCYVWFEYGTDTSYGNKTVNESHVLADIGYSEYINNSDINYQTYSVWSDYWRGQTFTTTTECDISNIKLNLKKLGNPGEFTVELFAVDGSHNPTGPGLGVKNLNGDNFTTSFKWYNISFGSSVHLNAGTIYSFVLDAQDGDTTNRVFISANSSNSYVNGIAKYSNDGSATWSNSTGYDLSFVLIDNNTGNPVNFNSLLGVSNIYQNQTSTAAVDLAFSNRYLAQTFTTNDSYPMTDISIYVTMGGDGATNTVTVSLYNVDGDGKPTGSNFSYGSLNFTDYSFIGSHWISFNMTPCILAASTKYAIVVDARKALIGSCLYWSGSSSNNYNYGQKYLSTNVGSSWTGESKDMAFKIISDYGDALDLGTMYHYRAVANNSNSTVYGSDIGFLTKPYQPSGLDIDVNSSSSTYISWTKGDGANRTVIEHNTISSWPRGSGTVIYNGTGTFCEDHNLEPATQYYYQAWSYVRWYSRSITYEQYSDLNISSYATTSSLPTIILIAPVNNSEQDIDYTNLSVSISATGLFNYTIDTSPDCGYASNNYSTSGNKYLTINLNYLLHGTKYVWHVNCSQDNNWVNRSFYYWGNITYVDPPVNNSFNYNTNNNLLTLYWNKVNRTHSCVLVRNNNSFPSSITDGTILQNNSNNSYNITLSNYAFFSVFSFNSTASIFSSTGLDIPWAFVGVNVFNESNPSQAIDFDLEVTNSDASIVYTNTSCSNTHLISFDDIPYGNNTIFIIKNTSGYMQRVYYKDIALNHFYNFSFYLPPFKSPVTNGTGDSGGDQVSTRLYRLRVVDDYDYPVADANIIIKRYINTSDSYNEIASLLTDGYGEADVYLIPNTIYWAFINATGYNQDIANFNTDPVFYGANYPIILQMQQSTSGDYEYNIWDKIIFNATMNSNGTIKVTFIDNDLNTTNAQFYTMERYNNTETYFSLNTTTSNSFIFYVHGINISREYIVYMHLNHSRFDYEITSIIVIPIGSPKYDKNIIETKIENSLGTFELGYVNFFLLFIPTMILLGLAGSLHHPGLGIILAGGYLGIIGVYISNQPVVVIPFLVAIGFILIVVKGGHLKL